MVTNFVAPHSAFGVEVREPRAARVAMPDRDRPPPAENIELGFKL